MRAIFLLLIVLFTASAQAVTPPFKIICASSVSTARIWNHDGLVSFHFEDVLGFDDFPVFSGSLTKLEWPHATRALSDLAVFGGRLEMIWPEAKCTKSPQSPLLIKCSGPGQIIEPAGTKLAPTSVGTSIQTQQTVDLNATQLSFDLGLDTEAADYTHYFVSFPFSRENCNDGLSDSSEQLRTAVEMR